jgi:hypothetical protein
MSHIGDRSVQGKPYRQAPKLFHILSHQDRLHILDELHRDEARVCHLQTVLGRPQAYVSRLVFSACSAVSAVKKQAALAPTRLGNTTRKRELDDTDLYAE